MNNNLPFNSPEMSQVSINSYPGNSKKSNCIRGHDKCQDCNNNSSNLSFPKESQNNIKQQSCLQYTFNKNNSISKNQNAQSTPNFGLESKFNSNVSENQYYYPLKYDDDNSEVGIPYQTYQQYDKNKLYIQSQLQQNYSNNKNSLFMPLQQNNDQSSLTIPLNNFDFNENVNLIDQFPQSYSLNTSYLSQMGNQNGQDLNSQQYYQKNNKNQNFQQCSQSQIGQQQYQQYQNQINKIQSCTSRAIESYIKTFDSISNLKEFLVNHQNEEFKELKKQLQDYQGKLHPCHLKLTYMPKHELDTSKIPKTTLIAFQSFVKDKKCIGYIKYVSVLSYGPQCLPLILFQIFDVNQEQEQKKEKQDKDQDQGQGQGQPLILMMLLDHLEQITSFLFLIISLTNATLSQQSLENLEKYNKIAKEIQTSNNPSINLKPFEGSSNIILKQKETLQNQDWAHLSQLDLSENLRFMKNTQKFIVENSQMGQGEKINSQVFSPQKKLKQQSSKNSDLCSDFDEQIQNLSLKIENVQSFKIIPLNQENNNEIQSEQSENNQNLLQNEDDHQESLYQDRQYSDQRQQQNNNNDIQSNLIDIYNNEKQEQKFDNINNTDNIDNQIIENQSEFFEVIPCDMLQNKSQFQLKGQYQQQQNQKQQDNLTIVQEILEEIVTNVYQELKNKQQSKSMIDLQQNNNNEIPILFKNQSEKFISQESKVGLEQLQSEIKNLNLSFQKNNQNVQKEEFDDDNNYSINDEDQSYQQQLQQKFQIENPEQVLDLDNENIDSYQKQNQGSSYYKNSESIDNNSCINQELSPQKQIVMKQSEINLKNPLINSFQNQDQDQNQLNSQVISNIKLKNQIFNDMQTLQTQENQSFVEDNQNQNQYQKQDVSEIKEEQLQQQQQQQQLNVSQQSSSNQIQQSQQINQNDQVIDNNQKNNQNNLNQDLQQNTQDNQKDNNKKAKKRIFSYQTLKSTDMSLISNRIQNQTSFYVDPNYIPYPLVYQYLDLLSKGFYVYKQDGKKQKEILIEITSDLQYCVIINQKSQKCEKLMKLSNLQIINNEQQDNQVFSVKQDKQKEQIYMISNKCKYIQLQYQNEQVVFVDEDQIQNKKNIKKCIEALKEILEYSQLQNSL